MAPGVGVLSQKAWAVAEILIDSAVTMLAEAKMTMNNVTISTKFIVFTESLLPHFSVLHTIYNFSIIKPQVKGHQIKNSQNRTDEELWILHFFTIKKN